MIVNTATKCGYTPQYEELEATARRNMARKASSSSISRATSFSARRRERDRGDSVEFCQLKFGTTFPIFQKIDVNGPKADPLFVALTNGDKVKWNFTKFLIDRNGNLVKRFEPAEKPFSFENEILALL
ncbi:MAG: glutathione peroxidase [Bacillus subtilis]|nr:glutathione peroxidase [Bacillus subtilis]